MEIKGASGFDYKKMLLRSVKESFLKLSFKYPKDNLPMLFVYISTILMTILFAFSILQKSNLSIIILEIIVVAWLIVFLVNFALSTAEAYGKAQADLLRATIKDSKAHRILSINQIDNMETVFSASLKIGDLVYVMSGEQIPADGIVLKGAASVDESAITGESAPVIREGGSERNVVTGGTTVISDWLIIQVTSKASESFLTKMITMVETTGKKQTFIQKNIQKGLGLVAIIFLIGTIVFYSYTAFLTPITSIESIIMLIALLLCLAPIMIGSLSSMVNIAGINRLNQMNVLIQDEQAIEIASKVNVLMLSKDGAITLGNKQACEFIPITGVPIEDLADVAQLASLADDTPEGRSIVVLTKEKFNIRGRNIQEANMEFVPFSTKTKLSGVNVNGQEIRKGTEDVIKEYLESNGYHYIEECQRIVEDITNKGGIPLIIVRNYKVMGVIYLKDMIKQGIQEKFGALRKMGIKTIMMSEDDPVTAAAVAAEAGVDDFLANVTLEKKINTIHEFQSLGNIVGIMGKDDDDILALKQADFAVAMNNGLQQTKQISNMVDLDSSPIKLIDIVCLSKEISASRKSLLAFSVMSDITKYFVVISVLFFSSLNLLHLYSLESTLLSLLIYNALILIAFIPLALKTINYRSLLTPKQLSRNIFVCGVAGLIIPLGIIKAIELFIRLIGLI